MSCSEVTRPLKHVLLDLYKVIVEVFDKARQAFVAVVQVFNAFWHFGFPRVESEDGFIVRLNQSL